MTEPAADLAVALSIASSYYDRPVPRDMVVIGEVGLGGELRQVPQMDRRLAEAAKLGFTRALVPFGAGVQPGARPSRQLVGLQITESRSLAEAMRGVLGSGLKQG